MLARQGTDGEQSFLQRFKDMRVERKCRQRVFNAALRLAQLDQRAGQRGKGRVQSPFGPVGNPFQPAQRIGHLPLGPLVGQGLQGTDHIALNARRRLHGTAAGVKRRILARLGRQAVKFGNSMAQEFLFGARRRKRGFGLGDGPRRAPHGGPGGAQGDKVVSAEGVQHRAVAPGVQEAAVILLPMQLDQCVGQGAQDLAPGAAVIDIGLLSTVRRADAAQDQAVAFVGQACFGQNGMGGMAGRQGKFRRHLALRGPGAHQIGPPAPSQHKAKRIQKDRLSRPRLARQHVQAGPEGQFQPVDDENVANGKAAQHVSALRGAQ